MQLRSHRSALATQCARDKVQSQSTRHTFENFLTNQADEGSELLSTNTLHSGKVSKWNKITTKHLERCYRAETGMSIDVQKEPKIQ